jgi:hypothetical protein
MLNGIEAPGVVATLLFLEYPAPAPLLAPLALVKAAEPPPIVSKSAEVQSGGTVHVPAPVAVRKMTTAAMIRDA